MLRTPRSTPAAHGSLNPGEAEANARLNLSPPPRNCETLTARASHSRDGELSPAVTIALLPLVGFAMSVSATICMTFDIFCSFTSTREKIRTREKGK